MQASGNSSRQGSVAKCIQTRNGEGAVGKTKDKTGDGNRIGRRSDEKKMKCSGYYILLDVCNANWRVITLILKLKEQEKERGNRENAY